MDSEVRSHLLFRLGSFGIYRIVSAALAMARACRLGDSCREVSLSLPANPNAFAFVDDLRYFTVFFGTGVLGYLVRKDLRINAAALVLLFVLFVVSIRTPFAEVGAALFLGYAAAATLTWGPLRPLCNRFDTSFGIYIGAGPIQQTLLWLIPALTPLWLSLLAFAIVLPVAFLSWIGIEKPALRLRRTVVGLLKKRQPAVALPG